MSPKENERANILCVASLVCEVIPLFLGRIMSGLSQIALDRWDWEFSYVMSGVSEALSGALFIAGIVLLVIVRVKYPKNTFGKVLMWVYIVIGVIMLLIWLAMMIFLMVACNACMNELSSCPGLIF